MFLITGILWLIVSLVILRFDLRSVAAVGILVGVFMLMAGVNEFVAAFVAPGWRWLHALLGVLFAVLGILCLVYPGRTFLMLAAFFGWFMLFKGTADIVFSILTRRVNDLWWVGLVTGILEIGLAFWASGYFIGSAALLIIWVGMGAMFRGVTEIILAFRLRSLGDQTGSALGG